MVVEREYSTKAVHQGYIEPHAVVAQTGEDGRSTVWCSSQGHFGIRTYTTKVLGWDPGDMKVIPAEIGGGFGGKTTIYLEPLAALLSRRAGRAVKMVMTRDEVFRATGPTSGSLMRIKMGARRDGTLVAATAWMAYEAGAFPGSPIGPGVMTVFAPYDIPNVLIEGYDVVLNKPKVAAYRAPGAPIAAFAAESVVDEVAEELGMDPLEFRLQNAVTEGVMSVYGPRYRKIGFVETLEAARDHPHYSAPLGPWQGRGVASGYWFNFGGETTATVSINEDGTAVVMSGCPDIGGTRTALAQMAAEELGIDVYRIEPVVADTHSIGYNDMTGGSRVAFAVGIAVVDAARQLIEDMCTRASLIWDVPPEEVEWVDGRAQSVTGAAEPLTLEELAAGSGGTGGPLSATITVNPRGAGAAFSTQICDVEVDPETGLVTILRYTVTQDAGRAIHPDYVEGQMQGGAVQGIGWALNEEYIFDRDGVMENPGFLDYRMPGGIRPAHDRHGDRGGAQSRPSLRCAGSRRSGNRPSHGGGGQRRLRRHGQAHEGPSHVPGKSARGVVFGLMAQVYFPTALQRLTGGLKECEVEASTVRELVARLEERFPGIGEQLASAAVAIDGDIVPSPLLERLEPEAEIHFLPVISGG